MQVLLLYYLLLDCFALLCCFAALLRAHLKKTAGMRSGSMRHARISGGMAAVPLAVALAVAPAVAAAAAAAAAGGEKPSPWRPA